jgi:hypothetical protein
MMIENLQSESIFGEDADLNRLNLNPINLVEDLEFPELVSINTQRFFDIINVNSEFLTIDPEIWHENESYLNAEKVVRNLSVVNDACERAISFFQQYKSKINKENQKQNLLHTVENTRKKYKMLRKQDVIGGLLEKVQCNELIND